MSEHWTLERIKQLVHNKIQENLHLEYKACADLMGNVNIPELTKDVSAFANADGGTLIFGVSEGRKENKHVPEQIDEGFERGGKVNSIWLEDVLLGNIAPKIQGLKPYEIELENGNFILVLEVPQSQHGAHMAKDHRYYKRRQTKAEPMEHYEVEDVRNRSRGPLLRLKIDFPQKDCIIKGHKSYPFIFELNNLVDKPAEYIQVLFFADSRLKTYPKSSTNLWNTKPLQVNAKNLGIDISTASTLESSFSHKQEVLFNCYSLAYGLPQDPPVWRGNQIRLPSIPFRFTTTIGSHCYFYGWQILSPYMTLQEAFYFFQAEAIFDDSSEPDYHIRRQGEVNINKQQRGESN